MIDQASNPETIPLGKTTNPFFFPRFFQEFFLIHSLWTNEKTQRTLCINDQFTMNNYKIFINIQIVQYFNDCIEKNFEVFFLSREDYFIDTDQSDDLIWWSKSQIPASYNILISYYLYSWARFYDRTSTWSCHNHVFNFISLRILVHFFPSGFIKNFIPNNLFWINRLNIWKING